MVFADGITSTARERFDPTAELTYSGLRRLARHRPRARAHDGDARGAAGRHHLQRRAATRTSRCTRFLARTALDAAGRRPADELRLVPQRARRPRALRDAASTSAAFPGTVSVHPGQVQDRYVDEMQRGRRRAAGARRRPRSSPRPTTPYVQVVSDVRSSRMADRPGRADRRRRLRGPPARRGRHRQGRGRRLGAGRRARRMRAATSRLRWRSGSPAQLRAQRRAARPRRRHGRALAVPQHLGPRRPEPALRPLRPRPLTPTKGDDHDRHGTTFLTDLPLAGDARRHRLRRLARWLRTEFADHAHDGEVGSRLLSENDRVRVWEIRLAPGERWHAHRHVLDYFWTAVNAGRSRQHTSDGTIREVSYGAGETRHFPSVRASTCCTTSRTSATGSWSSPPSSTSTAPTPRCPSDGPRRRDRPAALADGVVDVHAHWLPGEPCSTSRRGRRYGPLHDRDGELHLGRGSAVGADPRDERRAPPSAPTWRRPASVSGCCPRRPSPSRSPAVRRTTSTPSTRRSAEVVADAAGTLVGLGMVVLDDPDDGPRPAGGARRDAGDRRGGDPAAGDGRVPRPGPAAAGAGRRGARSTSRCSSTRCSCRGPSGPTTTWRTSSATRRDRHRDRRLICSAGSRTRCPSCGSASCTAAVARRDCSAGGTTAGARAPTSGGARPGRRARRSASCTSTPSPTTPRRSALLVAHAGKERLLCGSDHPFDMAQADPVGFATSHGADAATITANARAFLAPDTPKESRCRTCSPRSRCAA